MTPVAFGLPGQIYVTCTPAQTRNMHAYPEDQRPRGQDAIFERIWGSFGVPLFVDGQCVGVLEFVTDKVKDSYDDDIYIVRRALEDVGLQTSTQIEHPKTTCIVPLKTYRTRKLSAFTKYHCLVPYFGLSSRVAAEKLSRKAGVKVLEGTFRNVRRRVGIPEWPYSGINQTTSNEKDILGISDSGYVHADFTELSPEQTLTDRAYPLEIQSNHEAIEETNDFLDQVLKGIFSNVVRRVGIPDWSNSPNVTWSASSPQGTRINQTTLFGFSDSGYIHADFTELSPKQTLSDRAYPLEIQSNHETYEETNDLFDQVLEGTFRNVVRRVGILEWPNSPNVTWSASSPQGTRINQTALFGLSDSGYIHADFTELSPEQTLTDRVYPLEIQSNHEAIDEYWIANARACPTFMEETNDLLDQGNEAFGMEDIAMADFFDYK